MNQKTRTQASPASAMPSLEVKRDGKGKIWSYLRQKWLDETPEEAVRQEYLCVLVNEYGYQLDQMSEELEVTGRGSGHARADFALWHTVQDKSDQKNPLIVVECKSDNVTICAADYGQGDNYARLTGARFFVTHNRRETKCWRVIHDKMPKTMEEIENIPHADASDKEIEDLIAKLKVFKEDEFADLLHQCHNVIRNREKLDPAAAFDEIAKILFIKVDIERRLRAGSARRNLFTADFLDEQKRVYADPVKTLFDETKRDYEDDKIFDEREAINLRFNTVREIVRLLERYNLSDTSEDIKGIAFERFLGRTFRGEIGQFFTPRTIVEFMIRMVEPEEGDIICDPASGSGGFLIRFFEIVRQQILADADRQYQEYKAEVEAMSLSSTEKARLLRARYDAIQATLGQKSEESRLWKLANRCIFGTDANERMARTSKMNMIMHGDGHGGIHHHDGFINVNGIFDGRFNIVLTNPPFGANVESGDVILDSELEESKEVAKQYQAEYGDPYITARERVVALKDKPIVDLFELPKSGQSKVKTEILFLERCLNLLRPGGRMGIVLPEGIFNNPSLAYVREFCEDRAFLRAIVSLPGETFYSSGASVKASLLFLQKFTAEEQADFNGKKERADAEIGLKYAPEIAEETGRLTAAMETAKQAGDGEKRKAAQKELADYRRDLVVRKRAEARALLKERFAYPIFMYEAEKVGIASTGEPDQNELYPNDDTPPGREKTCLEVYQEFRKDPAPLLATRREAFSLQWKDIERWDTFFYQSDFLDLDRQLAQVKHAPLGDLLNFTSRPWSKRDFPDGRFSYIEISFVNKEDGIVGAKTVSVDKAPSRATTLVKEGDILLATTRPYLGAFALVPQEYDGCVCSSGFALAAGVKSQDVDPNYVLFFLKSVAGLRQMKRRMTGGLYPAIVQDELEKIKVPLPPLDVQRKIVRRVEEIRTEIVRERQAILQKAQESEAELESLLLGIKRL